MCLAIPGRVVRWIDETPPFARAAVEFAGVLRTVSMACVPAALADDYVLVHAGIAISRISQQEAEKVLQTLAELDLDEQEMDVELDRSP